MPRISYADDFKREAVRLVTVEGHSRKQVARDLDVSLGSLRDWIYKLAPDGSTVSDKLPEAEQLRQLKREVDAKSSGCVELTRCGGQFRSLRRRAPLGDSARG